MTELVSVVVPRYRDAAGNPTCICSVEEHRICPFYRHRHFGASEFCTMDSEADCIGMEVPLQRRGDTGFGTLVPGDKCPLWKADAAVGPEGV